MDSPAESTCTCTCTWSKVLVLGLKYSIKILYLDLYLYLPSWNVLVLGLKYNALYLTPSLITGQANIISLDFTMVKNAKHPGNWKPYLYEVFDDLGGHVTIDQSIYGSRLSPKMSHEDPCRLCRQVLGVTSARLIKAVLIGKPCNLHHEHLWVRRLWPSKCCQQTGMFIAWFEETEFCKWLCRETVGPVQWLVIAPNRWLGHFYDTFLLS